MRFRTFLAGCLRDLLSLDPCTNSPDMTDYVVYIDPFVGTGGHGHTFPDVVLPHDMISPSPGTHIDGWDACSGYYYADSTINGFSHTHLNGIGCCDYGDVLPMPTVGEQKYLPTGSQSQKMACASSFSRQNEATESDYYSAFLDTYQVKAELTTTRRTAIHRYTFPESREAGFVLDFDYSLQRQTSKEMEIGVISPAEICGRKKAMHWAFDQYISFYTKFSKPFTYTLVTDSMALDEGGKLLLTCKALLHFNTVKDKQVFVKVGISIVDIEDAHKNVEAEIPDWDFDGVCKEAYKTWNRTLSKIDITTDDKGDRTIFYTALYHTTVSLSLFMGVDGHYLGMGLQVHQGDTLNPIYTVFSLWDTFRALHPLMTIIGPDLNSDFIRSLIKKQQEGGISPVWDMASSYTDIMIDYHTVPVIVDAYMKGDRNLGIQEAYRARVRAAEYDTTGIKCPALVLPHLMPRAKYYKNSVGYVPCGRENESIAKALEHAYDDWCISIFADALNDYDTRDKYARFARAYEFYLDPETRLMRGLGSKGEWCTPFNSRSSTHRNDDYCEGTI